MMIESWKKMSSVLKKSAKSAEGAEGKKSQERDASLIPVGSSAANPLNH